MNKPTLVLVTMAYTLLGVAAFNNMPMHPKKDNPLSRTVISALWPIPVMVHGMAITFVGKPAYFGEPQP